MGVIAKPSSSNHEGEWFIKGAVEEVLTRCDTYICNRSTIVLDEKIRSKILTVTSTMSEDGLRVLALASGRGNPDSADRGSGAKGLTFAGLVGMFDPPRPGVSSSIRRLLNGGVRVMMITGDSSTTALSIARALGIPMSSPANSAILTGLDIDALTDSELSDAISRVAIFARTTPRHKLKIIKALQQRGDIVAMTGDGVNDAPALRMADIGVSMGIGGTDVAKEAADMVLSDDDFSTILTAIEEGALLPLTHLTNRERDFFKYSKFPDISAVNLCGGIITSRLVDYTRSTESPERHANPLDKYSHGWSTSSVPWCRTSRSSGHVPSTPTKRCPHPHTKSNKTRLDPSVNHPHRHNVRIRNGNERWTSHCTRYYYGASSL